MRRLRRITEQEVIAEFLKSEFHHDEFHHCRRRFEHLVLQADVTNAAENALAPGASVSPSRPHVA